MIGYKGKSTALGSGLVFIHFASQLRDDSKIKYSISFVDEIHDYLDDHLFFFRSAFRNHERQRALSPRRLLPSER
jgi:hypothetical protein